jgi:mRNA-degrading endonuclease RelE of RelBE toxin-antitoxin system
MRIVRSNTFKQRFRKSPKEIQRRTEKALRLLVTDLQHPSLRAKIIDETNRIWQARVSRSWRLYFRITGDTYELLTLKKHK